MSACTSLLPIGRKYPTRRKLRSRLDINPSAMALLPAAGPVVVRYRFFGMVLLSFREGRGSPYLYIEQKLGYYLSCFSAAFADCALVMKKRIIIPLKKIKKIQEFNNIGRSCQMLQSIERIALSMHRAQWLPLSSPWIRSRPIDYLQSNPCIELRIRMNISSPSARFTK
jgi:hypothetical protein